MPANLNSKALDHAFRLKLYLTMARLLYLGKAMILDLIILIFIYNYIYFTTKKVSAVAATTPFKAL